MTPETLPWSRSFLATKSAAIVIPSATGQGADRYNAAIKKLRTQLRPTPESLCVIDMSSGGPLVVGGWELDRPLQIASMAKLSLLLAAGQLRDDVQSVVKWAGLRTWRDVVPALKSSWSKGKAPPFKALASGPADNLPLFDRLFDGERFDAGADLLPEFRSAWPNVAKHGRLNDKHFLTVSAVHQARRPKRPADQLKKDNRPAYDAQYQAYVADYSNFYDVVLSPVAFTELLQLAIKWSDNEAASACLSLLGLPYVWAVLQQTGLYDDKLNRGLWLGAPYASLFNSTMFRSPGSPQAKPISKRIAESEGDDGDQPVSTQVGTARAAATMFASLVQGTLFQTSNQFALDLLEFRRQDLAIRSIPENFFLFADVMEMKQGANTLMQLSKIGILGSVFSECAYLLRLPSAAGTASGAPNQLEARSFVVCALHATVEVLKKAGAGVIEIADTFAGK